MNTISLLVLRAFDLPRGADQSLQAISIISCFGLAVSLCLIGLGLDVGSVGLCGPVLRCRAVSFALAK